MSDVNLELSPVLKNLASEGGLDTAILNGNSIQRTLNMVDCDGKKIVSYKDGELITVSNGGEYLLAVSPGEFVEARGECSALIAAAAGPIALEQGKKMAMWLVSLAPELVDWIGSGEVAALAKVGPPVPPQGGGIWSPGVYMGTGH